MRRIFLASLGYGTSVFVAVTATLVLCAYMSSDFWYDLKGIIIIYCFCLLIAGLGGLPAFTLAVIVQIIREIRSPYYWIMFGLLSTIVANILFAVLLMPFTPTLDVTIFIYTSFGGLLAGGVYALFEIQFIFRKEPERIISYA